MQARYLVLMLSLMAMSIALVVLVFKQAGLFHFDDGSSRDELTASDTGDLAKKRHPEMPKFIPYRDSSRDAKLAIAEDEAKRTLLEQLLEDGAIKNEAILRFRSNAAFESFLTTAQALGVDVLGAIPKLRALRVGFDEIGDLFHALQGLSEDAIGIGPNYLVSIPTPPEDNPLITAGALVPFGNRTLEWLGVPSDNSSWGKGILVAVLDTGIAEHPTFRANQIGLTALDGVVVSGDSMGHGTAVASLIGGNDSGTPGIAPAAQLLNYPIVNAEGFSDSFTLAQAIFDAVASGADIINISLGSQGDSPIVREAITEAIRNDVIVVAAAGNEGVQQVAYPAAYPGVIGVGSIDASGQHVYFSNTGPGVTITAPGIGINTAWGDEGAVQFSGTSASAPIVAGTLAALMSEGVSYAKAIDLMVNNANEAGPPGVDNFHGNGNLDVDRIMNFDTPGIYDVAVASQTFDDPYVTASTSHRLIQPVVENRGTETLYNVNLTVSVAGTEREFNIPVLKAGQIVVKEVPVSTAQARLDGSVRVVSQVNSSVKDYDPRDNRLTSLVVVKTPES